MLVWGWRHGDRVGDQEPGKWTPFLLKFLEKNFSVLSTNMAALSRGFKPRISLSGYRNTTVLRRIVMSFRGRYRWRVHLGWRIRGRVSPEFKTWSSVHSQHGQCRTQHKRLAVFHYCGTNGKENQSSTPNRQCAWYLSYQPSLLAVVSISLLFLSGRVSGQVTTRSWSPVEISRARETCFMKSAFYCTL